MRSAFSLIELVFVIVILGILSAVSIMYIPRDDVSQATDYLIHNIKYTKTLAQLDDRYFGMLDVKFKADGSGRLETQNIEVKDRNQVQDWKNGLWRIQFHRSGTNAKNSYSIYADNAKNGTTNNFDGIPNNDDIIARDPQNQACLSGYSLSNLKECENNFSPGVKLEETYGVLIDNIQAQPNCQPAANGAFSILFDNKGTPYCRQSATASIEPLTAPIRITLKRGSTTANICVTKGGVVYGTNEPNCEIN